MNAIASLVHLNWLIDAALTVGNRFSPSSHETPSTILQDGKDTFIWLRSSTQQTVAEESFQATVVDTSVVVREDNRLWGTLWTDLKLYPPFEYLARTMVSAYMQDYRVIRTAAKTRFCIEDMLGRHAQDKAAILSALSEPHSGPTMVMTHHLPVRQLISPARTIGGHQKRAMNNGFACDLWDEIRGFDIHTWIWGHSHEGENWTSNGEHETIRFVTNQRG